MRPLICYALIAVAITLAPARADFHAGLKAYEQGDYGKAYIEALREANNGDAVAQLYLGVMYYIGQGAPRDFAEAAKWYLASAEQGNVRAQSNLGVLYINGHGVSADMETALMWFIIAENGGEEIAGHNRKLAQAKMPAKRVKNAQRRAQAWIKAHTK